jgi:hypothetical protein
MSKTVCWGKYSEDNCMNRIFTICMLTKYWSGDKAKEDKTGREYKWHTNLWSEGDHLEHMAKDRE